jgi:hypothetical protein
MATRCLRSFRLFVVTIGLVAWATAASAAAVTYLITTNVTFDSNGFIGIGNALLLELELESTTPDENPAIGAFLSTLPGTLFTDFGLVPSVALSEISAPGVAGDWTAWGTGSAPLVGSLQWTLDLLGLGLTPDQTLPDFDTLTGGELLVGSSMGLLLSADVVSVLAIPEPGTAALLGLGLLGLGLRSASSKQSSPGHG